MKGTMRKSKEFRKLKKESMFILLPPRIVSMVRDRAARRRQTLSEASAEAMAIGLGLDPSAFGITPNEPSHSS